MAWSDSEPESSPVPRAHLAPPGRAEPSGTVPVTVPVPVTDGPGRPGGPLTVTGTVPGPGPGAVAALRPGLGQDRGRSLAP